MTTDARASAGLAILRIAVGVIFLTHGIPKLLGGVPGTADFFGQLGIPAPTIAAWVVTLLEVGGGLLLVLGLLVVPVAVLFIIHMAVGLVLVHLPEGWYVVGPGQGGAEFNVLLIAANLALVLGGGGLWALDSRKAETGASREEPSGERYEAA